mmetsp:Transcript_38950/g.121697  ORF Transcript_38950/g.121697 Transcript_38950/m.121697 type:complete len:304 (+) Transcript_38950:348-1259(+)
MTSPSLLPLGTLNGGAMSRLPSMSGFQSQQPTSPASPTHCRSRTKAWRAASPRAPSSTTPRARAWSHRSLTARSCVPTWRLRSAPCSGRPRARASPTAATCCAASQARLSILRAARSSVGMSGCCFFFSRAVRPVQALRSAAYMAILSSCWGSSAQRTAATSRESSAPAARSPASSAGCPGGRAARSSGERKTGPRRPTCRMRHSASAGRAPCALIILSTSMPKRSRLTLPWSSWCMVPSLTAARMPSSRLKPRRAPKRRARSIRSGSSRKVSLAGSGVLRTPPARSARPRPVKSSTQRELML